MRLLYLMFARLCGWLVLLGYLRRPWLVVAWCGLASAGIGSPFGSPSR
jgi:hypothetical protein